MNAVLRHLFLPFLAGATILASAGSRTRRPAVRTAGLLACLLVLAACASPGSKPADPDRRPDWPPAFAADHPQRIFEIDPDASSLRVLVAPAGSLARLGHRHVIGGPVLSGRILLGDTVEDSRVDLAVDVANLVVDRPAWRADEGLEALDDDTIEATRGNLLGPEVLAAEDHPRIEVRSVSAVGPDWQADVTARVRIRGVVSELVVPAAIRRKGNRLEAVGAFDVDQTALGLQPFSAAGGALRVADSMRVRFRIVARPATG
ncbi:YceI family protein [Halomonas denitrificans]|nr:YceI family protein [Halomonas denitrificans]